MTNPAPLKRLTALVALCLLAACAGPGYYVQAAAGHLDLMRQREDVSKLLTSPDTDPQLAARLQGATEIRRFAIDVLGLPDNGSYRQYAHTGRTAVSWNVVAAPEFSMEPKRWCFPVAGCVPYRGYFRQADAEAFAGRLRRDGLDVAVSPVTAYSTLGWFDDPLIDTMFRHGEVRLAGLVFHELAHQALYVKGDTAFNESFASFVEETGLRLWLEARGEADRFTAWRERQRASRQFNRLLLGTRARLAALYGSELPGDEKREQKQQILERLEANYRARVRSDWNGRDYFGGWFASRPNNASLALVASYRGGLCAFERLYRSAGGDLQTFYRLAGERAALAKEARRRWLEQPCGEIAPGVDL